MYLLCYAGKGMVSQETFQVGLAKTLHLEEPGNSRAEAQYTIPLPIFDSAIESKKIIGLHYAEYLFVNAQDTSFQEWQAA